MTYRKIVFFSKHRLNNGNGVSYMQAESRRLGVVINPGRSPGIIQTYKG